MDTAGDRQCLASGEKNLAAIYQDRRSSAFAIAAGCRVTIHDSLYAALAQRLNVPLVTADRKPQRTLAQDKAMAGKLIWVGDLRD
jgi:predicted nucleic acid-binding protein